MLFIYLQVKKYNKKKHFKFIFVHSGRTAGGAYAGASAGGGVGASASLGGEVGNHGGLGAEAHAGGVSKSVSIVDEQPPPIGATYSSSYDSTYNSQFAGNVGAIGAAAAPSPPATIGGNVYEYHVQKVKKHPHKVSKYYIRYYS